MLKKSLFVKKGAYIWATILTMGIYALVACVSNLFFDPKKARNIGYKKD